MSHTILIQALEYVATSSHATHDTHYIFTLLTTQRQLFNSLAPILPQERGLAPFDDPAWRNAAFFARAAVAFFRLLMRADTFRFATTLCVPFHMTAAFVCEVFSKMDCVMDVELHRDDVARELVPVLMTLPYLRRVVIFGALSFRRTLRPLLKHPQESVRRSVAALTASNWSRQLSSDEFAAAMRDDIIPLIDSASCNAAVADYLPLLHVIASSDRRDQLLPRDIIMMLGDRLFQFFSSSNSHSRLVELSLNLLGKLAARSVRRSPDDRARLELFVDVFKEWPVLELLPDMIRCGVVSCDGTGVRSVVTKGIFPMFNPYSEASVAETRKLVQHHKQRFFDLQIPDIIYDSCFAEAGESSFARCSTFSAIAYVDSLSLLNRTHVLQKELRNFLLPWHREVMAELFRFKRQNARILGHYGELLLDFDKNEFDRRTAGARFIVNLVLAPFQMKQRAADENSQIIRVLFDEHEGLNIGPVLRSYLLVARTALNRTASIEGWLYNCHAYAVAEHNECIERGRRSREDDDGEDGTTSSRCYLTEFLESLEVH